MSIDKELTQFLSYLKHEKNASPHTIASYRGDLKQLALFLSEKKITLTGVDNIVLRSFLATLYEKKNQKVLGGAQAGGHAVFFPVLHPDEVAQ